MLKLAPLFVTPRSSQTFASIGSSWICDTCTSRFGKTTSILASWLACTVTLIQGGFLFARSLSSTRCTRHFCVFSAFIVAVRNVGSLADGLSGSTVLSSPNSSASLTGLLIFRLKSKTLPSMAVIFIVFLISFDGSLV